MPRQRSLKRKCISNCLLFLFRFYFLLFDFKRYSTKKNDEFRKSLVLKEKTLTEKEAELERKQKSIVEQRDDVKKMKREAEEEATKLKIWAEQLKAVKEKQQKRARAHNESIRSGSGVQESRKQKGWEGDKSNNNTNNNGTIASSSSSSPSPRSPSPTKSEKHIDSHPPPNYYSPSPPSIPLSSSLSPSPYLHTTSPPPSSSSSSHHHIQNHNLEVYNQPLTYDEKKQTFLKIVNEMKGSREGGGGRLQRVKALFRSLNPSSLPLSLHPFLREVNQNLERLQLELDAAVYEMDDEARVLSESFYFQVFNLLLSLLSFF